MDAHAHRRIYAKGFYDGLRTRGMTVTPAKYRMILEGQTAIARKIFENVPLAEGWTVNRIMTEMTRMGSTRVDLRTAEGCLNTLKDSGLVKEPQRGLYQRVQPRETVGLPKLVDDFEDVPSTDVVPVAAVPVVPPSASKAHEIAKAAADEARATAVVGEIAQRLRAQGEALIALAEELEDAAVGMEERIEQAEAREQKFRTLSQLLKEF